MNFLDSLLVLMLAATFLLQVSSKFGIPYPSMLVAAGVILAFIPGVPNIELEPGTALALFIAPAIVDAAYDFPIGPARRLWAPLVALALVGVLVTAAAVAWLGWMFAGLPLVAAIALGAIVAPPDAAATMTTLAGLAIPRSTETVLKGESLFNDATALLLFAGALAVHTHGGLDWGVGLRLALAVPGGILFGIACGYGYRAVDRFVTGTMRGNILQFVYAFLIWEIADHLQLSAILAEVAYAMTLAGFKQVNSNPRTRVHTFAVWGSIVFILNVFAFLLMGMQARNIIIHMPVAELIKDIKFSGLVVVTVVVTRFVVTIAYNRITAYRHRRRNAQPPATLAQAVLVSWSGMRGLVTLAIAFALPNDFPQRNVIVLSAFMVVLATLILQGLTLKPLIRWLKLDRSVEAEQDMDKARKELADRALATLDKQDGTEADHLRYLYRIARMAVAPPLDATASERYRQLGVAAIAAERELLEKMRTEHRINGDIFAMLEEEMDWRELTLLPDGDRQIEEN